MMPGRKKAVPMPTQPIYAGRGNDTRSLSTSFKAAAATKRGHLKTTTIPLRALI